MIWVDWKKLNIKLDKFHKSAAQISILVITLILYLFTKNMIFGILVAIELIAFVALEIYEGIQKNGIKYEIKDTLKSLGIALLIWFLISFFLQTSVPLSAVVSCSMLPSLQRGDMVVIQGAQIDKIKTPETELNKQDFAKLLSSETFVNSPYKNFTVNGSIFSYCIVYQFADPICKSFFKEPQKFTEHRGEVAFTYTQCKRKILGSNKLIDTPCVSSISYNGKEYALNFSNDIIVYQPNKYDLFSYTGDIIHRVQLKIKSENQTYVLTKGDNNNIFDIQFFDYKRGIGNTPVKEQNIKGLHLFTLPYIGYFKLFISGFFEELEYCNTNLVYLNFAK